MRGGVFFFAALAFAGLAGLADCVPSDPSAADDAAASSQDGGPGNGDSAAREDAASDDATTRPDGDVGNEAGANDARDDATPARDAGCDAQVPTDGGLAPLCAVPIPQPTGGDVIDVAAAVRLGKAIFWDVQTGGDGKQACASCHFSAGVDTRRLNTIHPGPNGTFESDGVTGAGQTATIANIGNDDRVGAQGVMAATFNAIAGDPATGTDDCTPAPAAPFGTNRQVTPRNAPTVIGAVFYRDLFWDGRASHAFNGVDPFGATGNAAGSLANVGAAALASQAVGPPNNPVEMSCAGRSFNGPGSLATKMLARQPLHSQKVSPNDGVLGVLSASPGDGLACNGSACTYRDLVVAAFGASLGAQAEAQFSRLWGQALLAYEATLVPDDTPFDRYLAGSGSALTASQVQGLSLFTGKGQCVACHAGPELSDATWSFATRKGLVNEDTGDQGFHNTGVRPGGRFPEDLGRADVGPKGVTYSVSAAQVDRGAFKTPSLRNVKLTAPYFHNGGKATLDDVLAFYARGGDFNNPSSRVRAIVFLAGEQAALVDFLANALTDCRVEKERAPFDHPSLDVPNGPSLPAVGAAGVGSCP